MVQHEVSRGDEINVAGSTQHGALDIAMITIVCLRSDTSGSTMRDGVRDTIKYYTMELPCKKTTKDVETQESGRFKVMLASPHSVSAGY